MGNRTREQLYEQYIVERELADRLRRSDRKERKRLYSMLYDELFQRVPHHPQLSKKSDPALGLKSAGLQMNLLERFLTPDSTFLEIGCGDCALSLEVARRVRRVYGIDVARKVSSLETTPENFSLIISDGTSIGAPPDSVDLAYSNQLLEHLHPDDVLEHMQNVYRALTPGGVYIFTTPHRFAGPHDISKYFGKEAKGLHLHEYTYGEIAPLLRSAGFSRLSSYKRFGSRHARVSFFAMMALERFAGRLPSVLRLRMSNVVFRTIRIGAEK
jgi:SAM-dependent methyltransferase